MSKNLPGLLISLEGIDGSGKSSTALALAQILKTKSYPVIVTKEPGATPLGVQIRQILQQGLVQVCSKAEYLLFAADRAQHVEQFVRPALDNGNIVISDRMADSSLAYQGYGRGLNKEIIGQVNSWALADIQPDITIYLSVDFETSQKRISQRRGVKDSIESEKEEFFAKVIEGFEQIFSTRKEVIKIDSIRPFDHVISQLHNIVLPVIENKLKV